MRDRDARVTLPVLLSGGLIVTVGLDLHKRYITAAPSSSAISVQTAIARRGLDVSAPAPYTAPTTAP